MAGLLDNFGEFLNTPAGMGLLSAVGSGLVGARRGRPMNTIGAGLIGGLQGYANAQDQQQQTEFNKTRKKLLDSQVAENELQAQARQQAMDQQKEQRNYLASIGQVTNPAAGSLPNKFDPMKALSLGMSPDMVKIVADAPNLGRSKVARTIEGQDSQGNKMTYQLDDYGQRVGDGVQGYTPPVQVDLGGRVQFVKPQAGVTLGKTMTPGEQASNAVARANLGIAQQRLNIERQGKPEFRDGQWVAPPRDMKPGDVRPVTPPTASRDANDALALINQARTILPNATGSYAGATWNQLNRVFGYATEGDKASAQLKAIGGMLTSKMPKMSGPQSDKDVALYREMAGRVGDETLPIELRQSALDAVEQIQQRYSAGGGASGTWNAPNQAGGAKFLGFE